MWGIDPLLSRYSVTNGRCQVKPAICTQQQHNNVMQPVSKQRMGKRASTTIELMLETEFSIWFVQSGLKEYKWGNPAN